MSPIREPEPTRLESADEILDAINARKGWWVATNGTPRAGPAHAAAHAQRERPTQRPPLALLCILDDAGKQEGEWVRLRAERTVIGRSDGDVRIAHDVQMSARHAAIVREQAPAGWRWTLHDLGSTNGTLVRVGTTILHNANELLVGQGRYRFEEAMSAANVAPSPDRNGGTQLPQPAVLGTLVPALVEMTPAGPGQRVPLALPEYWLGSDPESAAIVRQGDPFVDARHARFFRDMRGQWHVANNASVNGVWLRIKSIGLDRACQFRLGEQRFLFRVCES
jgi:hypothetical protein